MMISQPFNNCSFLIKLPSKYEFKIKYCFRTCKSVMINGGANDGMCKVRKKKQVKQNKVNHITKEIEKYNFL